MKTKEELLLAISSSEESTRLYAVEDIADSKYSGPAINLVKRLSIENSAAVKNSIISALQKLDYSPSYPELFAFFSSPDAFLRNSSVSILSSYGEEAAIFLTSYLDHSNREVRKLIIDCLMEIVNYHPHTRSQVLDVMRACLHDPDVNVVITAVEYIGKLGDKESSDSLIELFQKTNIPMLRSSILDTIFILGDEFIFNKMCDLLISNIDNLKFLFLPQILRFLAGTKRNEEFTSLINSLEKPEIYADDIIKALSWIKKEKQNDYFYQCCFPIIKNLIPKLENKESKFSFASLLLDSEDPEIVFF